MKTLTTKWANHQEWIDAPRNIVLKLTDGSSTFYFSNRPMKITDGTCYPYLSGDFSCREGFDPISRRWITPTVSLRLANEQMELQDDASYLRVSDKIAGVEFNIATLYGVLGGDSAAVSDMMVIFDGQITEPLEVTATSVIVTITDRSLLWNIQLPNRLVSDEYPAAPNASLGKVIPIAYGSFTQAADSSASARADYTGTGLAAGVAVTEAIYSIKAIFADHVIKTWDALWFAAPFGVHPMQTVNAYDILAGGYPDVDPTLNTNDSGCATATGSGVSAVYPAIYLEMYLDFADADDTGYDISTYDEPSNLLNAFDNDADTYSDTTPASEQYPHFPMRLKESDGVRDIGETTGYILDGIFNRGSSTAEDYNAQVFYDNISGNDTASPAVSWTPGASPQTIIMDALGAFGDLHNPETKCDICFVLWAHHTTGGGSTQYIRVHEARARLVAPFKAAALREMAPYGEFDGKAFGSWIDDAGHSNNYDEGDLIEDPVQIIQDILRTWLSLGDTNIDHVSFATAENASVAARLNLHEDNKIKVYDIARQLCEQSTAAVYVSCNARWRAADLDNDTPTTNKTIIWSDMIGGPTISSVGSVYNRLVLKSRWQTEYGDYRDSEEVEDATSQSAYGGVYTFEASWPNICGTSKDLVAAWLVNTTDGLWSKDHNVVNLSLRGWKHFDLDCGDTIELDATSVDPHILLRGDSWDGHQFMVAEIAYRHDRIDIKAVELYG